MTHVQEIPHSFDRVVDEGKHALLDMLRHQNGKKKKKERFEAKIGRLKQL